MFWDEIVSDEMKPTVFKAHCVSLVCSRVCCEKVRSHRSRLKAQVFVPPTPIHSFAPHLAARDIVASLRVAELLLSFRFSAARVDPT